MNDFSELETELKKLRPAPVPDGAVRPDGMRPRAARADADRLVSSRGARNSASIWWSLGLGLTAACALVLVWLAFFAEPPRSSRLWRKMPPAPVGARGRVAYNLPRSPAWSTVSSDEGLVFSPNQSERPLRRVRYDTRETMQWRNPQTGASLRVSYPAEQVVLTPVSFQ